jgi:hypothetical protein
MPASAAAKTKVLVTVLAAVFLLFISSVFFIGQIEQAAQKPFWVDEVFSLSTSIKDTRYVDLIKSGASLQASPAPLDYIAQKTIYKISPIFEKQNIKPEVYFRFFPILITLIAAFLITWIVLSEIFNANASIGVIFLFGVLACFLPFSFLYERMVYFYALETRPYALWNSMWALCLTFQLLSRNHYFLTSLCLTMLAFSATSSIFQIAALAVAFLITEKIQGKTFQEIFMSGLKIFLLPMAVNFYYAFRVGSWRYDLGPDEWDKFCQFWRHEFDVVPMMMVALGLCLFHPDNRRRAIVPVTALTLYFLGPIIFWLTYAKGCFFAERQYIYYDLHRIIFLAVVLVSLPAYLKGLRNQWVWGAVLVLSTGIILSTALRPKVCRKFSDTFKRTALLLTDREHRGIIFTQ